MAFRVTPVMKIAGATPQPAFGSWISAGAGLAVPADAPIVISLGTACSAGNDAAQLFTKGEEAWIIDPDGTDGEAVRIMDILNNTLTLGPQTTVGPGSRSNPVTLKTHPVGVFGTGAFILPKQMANNVLTMYEDGGVGPFLYIGRGPTFTAAVNRIYKLTPVPLNSAPTFWNAGMFSLGNPFDLSELFVLGTANDKYVTSLCID